MISIVVLAWNNLPLTQACVASLRATCDVDHQIIVVDNGSEAAAAAWAEGAADVAVLLPENLGFARGMNAGLQAASGDVVAFVNNDTTWPTGWTGPLLEHFRDRDDVGIVAPAVSAAGNPVTVRDEPGDEVVTLDPFSALPSGVVYLMRTDVARELGGWTERYRVAMSEDLDLCFTCWTNDLEIIVDTRVVIHHELHASLDDLEDDRKLLWRENLDLFLDHWTSVEVADIDWLDTVSDEIRARNVRHARAAAAWLRRQDEIRATTDRRIRELRDQQSSRLDQMRAQVRDARASSPPTDDLIGRVARRLRRGHH